MFVRTEERKVYTIEEYLDCEISSEQRHEYIDSEIFPMAGGTPNHNKISGNLYAALNVALKSQAYDVFVADQRLWIPRKRIYTYPDVMVVRGELKLQEGRKDTITNPLAIAEILSDSTRSYDKDEKFAAYRTIPSFCEYLLIDQHTVHIEHYFKTDEKHWLFSEYEESNETLSLNSFPFQISLADLYHKIQFEPSKSPIADREE